MDIESILQGIAEYQQKLSENNHISQQIKQSLVTLQERLRAIPEPTTEEQIYEEIETTYLTIDCIYNKLHENPPALFTTPGTKDGITYKQRVDALMTRLSLYQENKNLCDFTLCFLISLKQINLGSSEEQKAILQGNLSKEKTPETIAILNTKKTDKSLHEDTKRWLENTKYLSFLPPHTSLTLSSRKNQTPKTGSCQTDPAKTSPSAPIPRRKLTSV